MVYGNDNNSTLNIIQNTSLTTTELPLTSTSSTPKPTKIQPTEASNESTATFPTNLPEAITTTLLPVTNSTLQSSHMTSTTTESPKIQVTADSTNITAKIETNLTESVAETTTTSTLASTKIPDSNPIQTTTILPEIIAPTPNIPPPIEATTKNQEIPMTMIISTSTEFSAQPEVIPTPQPLRTSSLTNKIKRNAAIENTTSTMSTTMANLAPENLPTTTLATTLATVPLKAGDPTKKPENGFKFYETTTKGIDATTTTQSSLPTTSVGMETTSQVCIRSIEVIKIILTFFLSFELFYTFAFIFS